MPDGPPVRIAPPNTYTKTAYGGAIAVLVDETTHPRPVAVVRDDAFRPAA